MKRTPWSSTVTIFRHAIIVVVAAGLKLKTIGDDCAIDIAVGMKNDIRFAILRFFVQTVPNILLTTSRKSDVSDVAT